MFRSNKIIKFAFVMLGAVVLMSGEAEAAQMRPKTLSQQITPGVTNTDNVEGKGGCPVAVASARGVKAAASVRSNRRDCDSDESDDSEDEDRLERLRERRRRYTRSPRRSRSKSCKSCKIDAAPLQGSG